VSFHPRIINIAKSAEIVWKEKDYRFDRALWNGAVEEIAKERTEDEAWRFASFVKKAYHAYGRPFPYTRPVIQDFLNAFRAGKSWSVVLGPGYQDPDEEKSAHEGEIQNPLPSDQIPLLSEEQAPEQGQSTLDLADAYEGQSAIQIATYHTGTSAEANLSTITLPTSAAPESHHSVLETGIPINDDLSSPGAEVAPDPDQSHAKTPGSKEQGGRVQITHANLLDVPAAITHIVERVKSVDENTVSEKSSTSRSQSIYVDSVSEKDSVPRSPRRIELDKAASIFTTGLKSQASFQRGFAKLNDDQLYASLLHMFGSERVQMLVTG
jgi:hypothetical protein